MSIRAGSIAGLVVIATMLAGISSAQAQTAGVCIFSGLSGQLQGNGQPAGTGIPNALPKLSSDPLSVDRGSYSFSGRSMCAAVVTSTPVVGNFQMLSSGFYDNLVCGTGFAHDLDGSDTFFGAFNVSSGNPAGYEIPFVAGTGPMLIGPDDRAPLAGATELLPPAAGALGTHPLDGKAVNSAGVPSPYAMHGWMKSNHVGVGEVTTVPASPDNCLNAGPDGDTDQFSAAGFFVLARYRQVLPGQP